ncbi:hypothetical protein DM02DRAFT_32457 [Periconia macrospinosa]|uniref:Zn(2)-C6 fungal-type domain-containing protein n=1 Tax=Periconia macrospinosa TaxID=97972 RepID=A0A2V1DKG6_9PLEO|nr:hypothetical protein DM02DRAFT_32457 [Periconia macrospinosa]
MSLPYLQPSGSDRPAKLAIPRLPRQPRHEPPPKPSPAKRPRVSMACRSCRIRKVRCNGGRPKCSNCRENSEPCAYDETRRNRLKIASDQLEDMKALLQDLRGRVNDQDKHKINIMLAQILDEDVTMRDSVEAPHSLQHYNESSIHIHPGPNKNADTMEDDLAPEQDYQTTGFLGRNSEIQLLRRLQMGAVHTGESSAGPKSPQSDSSTSVEMSSLNNTPQSQEKHQKYQGSNRRNTNFSSFYLDSDDLYPDLSVQPFDLPPRETAKRLLESYLITVQSTYPILAEPPFKAQFNQLYQSPPYPSNTTSKWLGLLNLVFAIGKRHADLIEEIHTLDNTDHHVYWSRAHVLGLEGFHSVGHADITQIQSTGLSALYLLSIGHVNRAWVLMGSSLRLTHALGLHVRNENNNSTSAQKEIWLRMWWGVYSLEGHLSTIVGRPNFVNENYCSAPLPIPLSTDQLSDEPLVQNHYQRYRRPAFRPNERNNAGSHLKSMIQLSMITQRVMTELYSSAAIVKPWGHAQKTVTTLTEELDGWIADLPTDLNFNLRVDLTKLSLERERLILNMAYISTKILITRPCVCRYGSHERGEPENFNKQTARACVQAAIDLMNLLPLDKNESYFYKMGQWWSVVHSLMQALIVLLLEMSYGTVHFPEDGEEILISIKRLIRPLRTMGKNNTVAGRAYTVAFQVLRKLALKLNAEISDLIWEDMEHSNTTGLDAQVPTTNPFDPSLSSPAIPPFPATTLDDAHASSGGATRDSQAADIWSDFYDNQTGQLSMFYTPISAPPTNNPTPTTMHAQQQQHSNAGNNPFSGPYFQSYQQYDPTYNNPFMTMFDEENPVTFDQRL